MWLRLKPQMTVATRAAAAQKSKQPRSIAFAKMPPSYRASHLDVASRTDGTLKTHWFGLCREQQQQSDCRGKRRLGAQPTDIR